MALEHLLHTPLAEAVRIVGSQSAFARLINRSQAAVWQWLKEGRSLPAEHVLTVEAATGVDKSRLRPDIYPADLVGMAA